MSDFEVIVEKIKSGSRISGRMTCIREKTVDLKEAYMAAHDMESAPLCEMCRDSVCEFISTTKGFRKYCSSECAKKNLKRFSSENNKKRNVILATNKKNKFLQDNEQKLKLAVEYYTNNLVTITEVANKFSLKYSFLRAFLHDNGLTKDRLSEFKQKKVEQEFSHINAKLNDLNWVNDKINFQWTLRNFANELGCSPNYVKVYLEQTHNINLKRCSSSYEVTIEEMLKKWNIDYQKNNRKILAPLEVDFFLPKHSIAIELNGLYWHSDKFKSKQYHYDKFIQCKEQGIHLVQFSDYEIDEKFDIVVSHLKSLLEIQDRKFYARKCELKEIGSEEYRSFLNENHFQGKIDSSIRYGLFHNEELVMVAGFSKSRFTKHDYELSRLCTKKYHNVVGGASKLLKHFITNNPESSIISYCDNSKFKGNVYLKSNFEFSHNTDIDYFWFNNKNRTKKSRYSVQKYKLGYTETENEFMKNQGFVKIFNCGHGVYQYLPNSIGK